MKIVGLTSRKNVGFTKGLGLYTDVTEYESFATASSLRLGNEKWIYIDVAGNDSLNARVFAHFGSTGRLVASIALGLTSLSPSSPDASSLGWSTNTFSDTASSPSTPSATAPYSFEQFFMVEWLNVRKHQISPTQIFSLQNQAWKELMEDCVHWVKLERVYGVEEVKKAYESVAKGGLGPENGFIWSLWDGERTEKPVSKL